MISGWSTGDILTLAKLCEAAYLVNSSAAVIALGAAYVGQVGDAQCQATVCSWQGHSVVAIRGTQVSSSEVSIPELLDDVDYTPLELSNGSRVATGPYLPLLSLWPSIAGIMPPGNPLFIGHSLGGVRAHYGPYFIPGAEVVSFGGIKGADNSFWTDVYSSSNKPLRIVHESDFAPGWPWDGPWGQPSDPGWLHNGMVAMTARRPGIDISIEDHLIGNYIAALSALSS